MSYGKVHPKNTLFMCVEVGTAKLSDNEYEMSASFGSNASLVTSKQTGKTFELNWQAILNLAVEAGVDKE